MRLRDKPKALTQKNRQMKYKITQLTEQNGGTFDESPDMYPDMLNGGEDFETIDDLKDWLHDLGYAENDYTKSFKGWGLVMQHSETEEIINVL